MNQHILIDKAKRYEVPINEQTPEDYSYSIQKGYWADNTTGRPMMLSDDPKRPQTKKCDIETGEDQKRE